MVIACVASACGRPIHVQPPRLDTPERRYVHARELRRIGADTAAGGLAFGRISDIGLHPNGSAVAIDAQARQLVLMSPDGRLIWAMDGRPGCCISFDGAGGIWILGGGYVGFDLNRAPLGTAGQGPNSSRRTTPLMFDSTGGYIVWFRRGSVPELIHVLATGDSVAYPVPPDVGSPDSSVFMVRTRDGQREAAVLIPHAPETLTAYRHDGYSTRGWADRYFIEVYNERGEKAWSLERPELPRRLTAAQRAAATAEVAAQLEHLQATGFIDPEPYEMPTHERLIRRVWFDDSGRLWIEHTAHQREGQKEADVYDADGAYLFTVVWPSDIMLSSGASRDSVAWGLTRDEHGIDIIVALSFDVSGLTNRRR